MTKLLKADFTRLFKNKVFWLGVIVQILLAVEAVYVKYIDRRDFPDEHITPDGLILAGAEFVGIIISVFMGSFIGNDYKCGTIRNKLAIGHSRLAIYFSNLIVCSAASLILHFVWFVILFIGEGTGLTNKFETPTSEIAKMIFISTFDVIAFAAIFLLVCMLVSSKSASSVAAVLMSFAMIMIALTIESKLNMPEYYPDQTYITVDENGETKEEHYEGGVNESYPTETERKIYEFLNHLLPQNQIRDSIYSAKQNMYLPLYSLSLTAVLTAAGAAVFSRKDLK